MCCFAPARAPGGSQRDDAPRRASPWHIGCIHLPVVMGQPIAEAPPMHALTTIALLSSLSILAAAGCRTPDNGEAASRVLRDPAPRTADRAQPRDLPGRTLAGAEDLIAPPPPPEDAPEERTAYVDRNFAEDLDRDVTEEELERVAGTDPQAPTATRYYVERLDDFRSRWNELDQDVAPRNPRLAARVERYLDDAARRVGQLGEAMEMGAVGAVDEVRGELDVV